MKKIISVILVVSMLLALSSCSIFGGDEPETTIPTITTENVEETSVLDKARAAYEAFFATTSPDFPITRALVTDLDANDIPEVIVSLGENGHIIYILSYGKTSGLNFYTPYTYSSTPANVFVSDDSPYLYFTDNGHTQATAWVHEAVCFTATDEGFSNVVTFSGDDWENVTAETWQNEELFNEVDDKYENIFEQKILTYTGIAKFETYSELCHSSNAEAYLERELSIDISAKRKEYSDFKNTATSLIKTKTGDEPDFVYVDDYDRNGTYEAFAFTGYDTTVNDNPAKTGKLWFVGNDKKVTLLKEGTFSAEISTFYCAFHTYLYAQEVSANNSRPLLWYVSGNRCLEDSTFKNSSFVSLSTMSINAASNSIVAETRSKDTYSKDIINNTAGTGENTKNYYFFDSPEGIMEYGATTISENQFITMGGQKYLDQINAKGYDIKNILYRANGLIHVNCYDYLKSEDFHTTNVTFKMTCSSVYPIDNNLYMSDIDSELGLEVNGGFYLPATIESIAIYP